MGSVTSTTRYVMSSSRYQSISSGCTSEVWFNGIHAIGQVSSDWCLFLAVPWVVVERDCVISWSYAFAFYIFFRNLTCHWFLYIKDYVEAVVEVKVLVLDLENSTDCQKDKLSVSKGRRYTVMGWGLCARKFRPGQTCSLSSYGV